jgi:hypothetical protein
MVECDTGVPVAWSAIKPVTAKPNNKEHKIRNFFIAEMTWAVTSGYAVARNRSNRCRVRSRPRTRIMPVMLGPTFVPDSASLITG